MALSNKVLDMCHSHTAELLHPHPTAIMSSSTAALNPYTPMAFLLPAQASLHEITGYVDGVSIGVSVIRLFVVLFLFLFLQNLHALPSLVLRCWSGIG